MTGSMRHHGCRVYSKACRSETELVGERFTSNAIREEYREMVPQHRKANAKGNTHYITGILSPAATNKKIMNCLNFA